MIAYKKAIKIKSDYHHAYTNLFELQLIQEQDFDQDLVQKFNIGLILMAFLKVSMAF
jgi:hypothetical protein